jgi:hypothetical protein
MCDSEGMRGGLGVMYIWLMMAERYGKIVNGNVENVRNIYVMRYIDRWHLCVNMNLPISCSKLACSSRADDHHDHYHHTPTQAPVLLTKPSIPSRRSICLYKSFCLNRGLSLHIRCLQYFSAESENSRLKIRCSVLVIKERAQLHRLAA